MILLLWGSQVLSMQKLGGGAQIKCFMAYLMIGPYMKNHTLNNQIILVGKVILSIFHSWNKFMCYNLLNSTKGRVNVSANFRIIETFDGYYLVTGKVDPIPVTGNKQHSLDVDVSKIMWKW